MNITFFGHSFFSNKEDSEEKMIKLIENISGGKEINFLLGGYGQFDDFAYLCAKKYQEKHNNCKLIFVSPYLNPEYYKLKNAKEYYDESIYPPIESTPLRFAISKRNEWMIDNSDYIIFYVNVKYGGAYNALKYCIRKGKKYTNIY